MGSFLGVVSDRVPEGLSIVHPGSYCFRCGHPISWYDNVPMLSYFLRRGRCRWCGGKFSAAHFLIEAFSALLTWFLWRRFGFAWGLLPGLIFVWLLLPISIIDFREQIIPNALSIPGILGGLGFSLLPGGITPQGAVFGALAGALGLWLLAKGYERLRHREGLGTGDVKLLAMIGAFLGVKAMVLALFLGSLVGALLGGGYLLFSRAGRHEPLPFGPFLAAGALFALLDAEGILRFYQDLLGRWSSM